MRKLIIVPLFILLGAFATPAQVVSNGCDNSLWPRVYSHYRFSYPVSAQNKIEPHHPCVQIRGRIDHITPGE